MSRRPRDFVQSPVTLEHQQAAVADTVDASDNPVPGARTDVLFLAERPFRLVRALYVNPTGKANHASNFYDISILGDDAVLASWSTETGEEGALVADTFVEFTLGDDLHVEAGAVIALDVQGSGVPVSLPAGRLVLEGYYTD